MNSRVVGLDVARAVAVLGMVVAHVGNDGSRIDTGGWALLAVAHGRPAALFAVLAGVTVSIMLTNAGGRDDAWATRRTRARVVTRGVLLILLGYLLVELDTAVDIVLDNLGLTMILALPFLRLPAWALASCGAVFLGMGRLLVEWLRPEGTLAEFPVLSELWSAHYPAVAWLGYMLLGMAMGSMTLSAGRTQLLLGGAGMAAVGAAFVVNAVAGDGPSTSLEPHSYSPLEMLSNVGVAAVVIAICCWLAPHAPRVLAPLAATGSMALTVYVAHLLVIGVVGNAMVWEPSNVAMVVLVVTLVGGAWAWRHWLGRGPLERALTAASNAVGDAVAGDAPTPRARVEA